MLDTLELGSEGDQVECLWKMEAERQKFEQPLNEEMEVVCEDHKAQLQISTSTTDHSYKGIKLLNSKFRIFFDTQKFVHFLCTTMGQYT